jgi:hypothetical protein
MLHTIPIINKEEKYEGPKRSEQRLDHLSLKHHAQVGIHRFKVAMRKNHLRLPSGTVFERRPQCCSQTGHRTGAAGGSRFDPFLFRQRGEDAICRPFLKFHLLRDEIYVSEET